MTGDGEIPGCGIWLRGHARDGLHEVRCGAEDGGGVPYRLDGLAGEPGRLGELVADRIDEELVRGRCRSWSPRRCLVVRVRVGLGVDQGQGQIDVGDPVAEGVMCLDDHPDLVRAESVDEPQLPQGPVAVERLALEAAHQRVELVGITGPRQRGQANVVLEIERAVVDPDRSTLTVGHIHQALSQARDARKAPVDVPAQLLDPDPAGQVAQGRSLEDRQRADVLGFVGRLDPEERGVIGAETFVVHRRSGPHSQRSPRRPAGPTRRGRLVVPRAPAAGSVAVRARRDGSDGLPLAG